MSMDLSLSFISMVKNRHKQKPELRLESDLKQVNPVLVSYAKELGITVKTLSVLHVCADSKKLYPHLIKHIESKGGDKKYIGQHVSRLKKLVRNLPWPNEAKGEAEPKPVILEEHLPKHLREIWFLLPRIDGKTWRGIPKDELKQHRTTLPLTPQGLALGLALLRVSNIYNIFDVRSLLEERSNLIYLAIKTDNPRTSWRALNGRFCQFRDKVRAHLRYVIEKEPNITLLLENLPEPLQSQLRTYIERARHGFKSDWKIIQLAMTKYGLEIRRHSEETIKNYVQELLLGFGYISHEMSIHGADIRDFLKLQSREVEVDGIFLPELYNPLVDCYRNRTLGFSSDRKEAGFDSTAFSHFIEGLAAVAAFNGFLQLRKLFLKEYKVTLDKASKEKRKDLKKKTFDRPWLNEQIQHLKVEFHKIVNEGSFKNNASGALAQEARRNLNLCLFYVALLALRYLGVRQQSIRDCKLGENVIFDSLKCITFLWTKTKNKKGICHRLNIKEHGDTHRDLIDGIWIFYKKVYPYISGLSTNDDTLAVREKRIQRVAGQFFLGCARDGLCSAFRNKDHFYTWFTVQAQRYLDFKGKPPSVFLNPHFLRAMYGDWLRFDLGFQAEQAAEMAGDSKVVFESEYITHPPIFDATDAWTKKNEEIRVLRDRQKENSRDTLQDEIVKQYKDEITILRETNKTQAETIKQLTDKNFKRDID